MLKFLIKRDSFTELPGKMSKKLSINILAAILLAYTSSLTVSAQSVGSLPYRGQDVSQKDEIPVLVKHLPDWETVRGRETFAKNVDELKTALGERPILDLIDFSAGTEAVTAPYEAGKLLIIEYSTPQDSIDADAKFKAALEGSHETAVYRRIGNYNAFVFDPASSAAANALLDQLKYEKTVQWLGKDPFVIDPERAFVLTIADVFMSTVLVIFLWIGVAVFLGVVSGYIVFSIRERKRAAMTAFSDAGGMTRLNLDGFTPEITPKRLLND